MPSPSQMFVFLYSLLRLTNHYYLSHAYILPKYTTHYDKKMNHQRRNNIFESLKGWNRELSSSSTPSSLSPTIITSNILTLSWYDNVPNPTARQIVYNDEPIDFITYKTLGDDWFTKQDDECNNNNNDNVMIQPQQRVGVKKNSEIHYQFRNNTMNIFRRAKIWTLKKLRYWM